MESQKERLLIVEDEPIMRALLKRQLAPYFDLEIAKDGVIGWTKFNQFQPKIVLADYKMPNKNGLQLFELIKSLDGRRKSIRINL